MRIPVDPPGMPQDRPDVVGQAGYTSHRGLSSRLLPTSGTLLPTSASLPTPSPRENQPPKGTASATGVDPRNRRVPLSGQPNGSPTINRKVAVSGPLTLFAITTTPTADVSACPISHVTPPLCRPMLDNRRRSHTCPRRIGHPRQWCRNPTVPRQNNKSLMRCNPLHLSNLRVRFVNWYVCSKHN